MIHLRPFALSLSKGWFHSVEWFDKLTTNGLFDKLTTNGLMDYLGLTCLWRLSLLRKDFSFGWIPACAGMTK